MKRVMTLMVAVMAATTFAQGKDIAGSWVLDAGKTSESKTDASRVPPALTIAVTATEITVSMGTTGHMSTLAFKLDGSPAPLEHGATGTAKLTANRLEATISSERGASTAVFAREGDWLVQEVKDSQHPMKAYYKRAPAKR